MISLCLTPPPTSAPASTLAGVSLETDSPAASHPLDLTALFSRGSTLNLLPLQERHPGSDEDWTRIQAQLRAHLRSYPTAEVLLSGRGTRRRATLLWPDGQRCELPTLQRQPWLPDPLHYPDSWLRAIGWAESLVTVALVDEDETLQSLLLLGLRVPGVEGAQAARLDRRQLNRLWRILTIH